MVQCENVSIRCTKMGKETWYCSKCKNILLSGELDMEHVFEEKGHKLIFLGIRTELEIKLIEHEKEKGTFKLGDWQEKERTPDWLLNLRDNHGIEKTIRRKR